MLADIDSDELAEWEAYDRLEPLDDAARNELACAIVASTMANLHRDPNRDRYAAADFMQDWAKQWRDQTEIPEAVAIAAIEAGIEGLGLTWET